MMASGVTQALAGQKVFVADFARLDTRSIVRDAASDLFAGSAIAQQLAISKTHLANGIKDVTFSRLS